MLTRSLTIRFHDHLETTIELPGTYLDELESAQEFINEIERYKSGFQRFIARAPKLTLGTKTKRYMDLSNLFHTLINARKYLDMEPTLFGATYDQHFSIDLITGTLTLYRVDDKTERGTMSLDLIYSNWKELFYLDCMTEPRLSEVATVSLEDLTPKEVIDDATPADDLRSLISIYLNPYADQMKDQLEEPEAFKLWCHFFNHVDPPKEVIINYSGSGDSGAIDSVIVKTTSSEDTIVTTSVDIKPELETMIWDVIDIREAGFYNDDGGYGIMEMSSTSFKWDHYNYITHTDHSVGVKVDLGPEEAEEEPEIEVVDEDEEDDEWDEEEDDEDDEEPYDELWDDDHRHDDPTDYKDAMYDKDVSESTKELPF